jgi:hypothetical protein
MNNPFTTVFTDNAVMDFTDDVWSSVETPAKTPTAKVAFMLELTRRIIRNDVNFDWRVMSQEDDDKWAKVLDHIVAARDTLHEMTNNELINGYQFSNKGDK